MEKYFIKCTIISVGICTVILGGCGTKAQTLPLSQLSATAQALASHRTEHILYSFRKQPDGSQPLGGLAIDTRGNLYGTTKFGGTAVSGTVYVLSPSSTGYTERILHNFSGPPDGNYPTGSLSVDSQGTLYGTTQVGGAQAQYGTVFDLKPSGTGYAERILHSFNPFYSSDGAYPYSGVVIDNNGVLYGTTSAGGYGGQGTVFILKPSGSGYERDGWGFGEGNDGVAPYGGLLLEKHGFLYGTTSQGGAKDFGTVFKVKASGIVFPKVIHTFNGSNGASPQSSLVLGKNGSIYGTTVEGGAANSGTIFRLSVHNRASTETVLYSFNGSADGAHPYGAPLLGARGVIYGTAAGGGAFGNGVVYALTPSGTGYTERTVYSFKGKPDGSAPNGALIFTKTKELLGTTQFGGKADRGTVFAINP
ncbi:MAG TPA: choice-of-anchor tandem repeat GloVer-containing protein [Candidatus Cybelea sp.]